MSDLENYPEWVLEVACPRCGTLVGDVCYRADTYDSLLHPHKERRAAGKQHVTGQGHRSVREYLS